MTCALDAHVQRLVRLGVLVAADLEIRPGPANQLRCMSRWAPDFINGQLAKASRSLIPKARD